MAAQPRQPSDESLDFGLGLGFELLRIDLVIS